MTSTPLIIHGTPGQLVIRTFESAVALAKKANRRVRFKVNGVAMTIHKRLSPKHIHRQWSEISAARSRRYRQSAAYKALLAARAAELACRQDAITAAIKTLPGLVTANNLDHLIGWVRSFVREADDTGLDFDKAAGLKGGGKEWICVLFESAGYSESWGTDQPKEVFVSREPVGKWIIGQVVNHLRMGMNPHPALEKFCDDYFDL